jgi:MATE family multidrug resistance protein
MGAGVPGEVVDELGLLPYLLAVYLLVLASGGGANTNAVLVVLQGAGFRRHSAHVGMIAAGA